MKKLTVISAIFLTIGMISHAQFSSRIIKPVKPLDAKTLANAQETIQKCLIDLASDDAEKRLAAVLVLSKYDLKSAEAGVIKALDDTDLKVRRAALVSLCEGYALPQNSVGKIMKMLQDKDIEIRRQVSTVLHQCFQFNRINSPSTRLNVQEVKTIIQKAFTDPDAIIRKNILKYFFYYDKLITEEMLINSLSHEDSSVRLMTIERILERCRTKPAYANTLPRLIKEKDKNIRRLIAKRLLYNSSLKNSTQLLVQLSKDDDLETAASAFSGLLYRGHPVDTQKILTILKNPALNKQTAQTLVSYLSRLKLKALPLLEELYKNAPGYIQILAFKMKCRIKPDFYSNDELLKLCEDDRSDIRQAAFQQIATRIFKRNNNTKQLTSEQLTSLTTSKYSEIRQKILEQTVFMPKELKKSLLDELILDEDATIRLKAIEKYCLTRLEGWEEILQLSLEDEDEKVQKAAKYLIMRLRLKVPSGGNKK